MEKRKRSDDEEEEPTPGCSGWVPDSKVRIISSDDEESEPPLVVDDDDEDFLRFVVIDEVGSEEGGEDGEREADLQIHFAGSDVSDWDADLADAPEDPAVAAEDCSVPSKRKGKFCHVCRVNITQRLRRHAEEKHVPWWLSPNRACWTCQGTAQSATFASYRHEECPQVAMTDADIPQFVALGNGLLRILQTALSCATLEDLLRHIVKKGWYPQSPRAATLSFQQRALMWLFERENRMPLTPFSQMSVSPPRSPCNLLHFKVLLLVLPHVSQDVRDEIQRGEYVDRGALRPFQRRVTYTSDAHLHIRNVQDLQRYRGDRWDSVLRVTSLISNFPFPHQWDSFGEAVREEGVFGTVGIHPTICMGKPFIHPRLLEQLRTLLEHPRCVGFGEVGLDYVRGPSPSQQSRQRSHLRTLLAEKPSGLPLVMHCRGGETAFEDLAEIINDCCKNEPIMVHCFLGTPIDRDLLMAATKTLYLSVNPKGLDLPDVARLHLDAAIRGMELDRILLETDFPHLSVNPRQDLSAVARWVGRLKGVCASVVLEANRRNVARLFGLPE